MTTNEQERIEKAARATLDKEAQELPERITNALAAARQKALAQAESPAPRSATIYQFKRPPLVWSGAIAATVTALALTLVMQQPAIVIPADSADDLLALTELANLDNTEWQMVQDLDFALWLSELGDDALAAEPQS